MLENIHWLGHASFYLQGSATIYIDPWKLGDGLPLADIILVSHGHRDHLSPDDIAKIRQSSTVIVAAASCADQISGEVRAVKPGDALTIGDVKIEVVHAYNTDKPNHPRSAGNVGFVVEMDGSRTYHAGDTDVIPEMADISCDIALLPMGGTYTMNAEQAAEAASIIGPSVVVPMHWGDIVGSEDDVKRLRSLLPEGMQLAVLTSAR